MSCGYELSHGSESIIRENYLACLVWTSYFVTLLYTSAIILIYKYTSIVTFFYIHHNKSIPSLHLCQTFCGITGAMFCFRQNNYPSGLLP